MKIKILAAVVASTLAGFSYSSTAMAEWQFGIGTGLSRLNIDGDISVESALGGTVTLSADLDPDDVSDLIDTAIGFGGYATDGTWLIVYSYSSMTLEGDFVSGTVTSYMENEKTNMGVQVGYPVLKQNNLKMHVLGGVRNTSHDFKTRFTQGATTLANERDNSWTDLVLGVSAVLKFAPQWTWANQLDAGFGDSEGSTTFRTALDWQFAQQWSASFFIKAAAVELENANPGDADYYQYDVDETSLGASFLFHW